MPYKDSYVARIRTKIGHDFTLIMPTIDVIIENEGKLMLIYNRDFDGWSFPGGYVEPEMAWTENAAREAKEEAGLLVDSADLELIGSVSGPQYLAKYPNGDRAQLFANIFLANKFTAEISEIDESEIDEKKWMTPDEIKQARLTFAGEATYRVYQQFKQTGKTQNIVGVHKID
ncbi:MAG: NUDIX domain-containing protein [Lactobacillaceae bacterium]|jgi:ADP-ribose pyrophosphatase YjhB (NUDIX family)|nr:NUDIX domain-containing protein [Lactobacillaceae bacterium]